MGTSVLSEKVHVYSNLVGGKMTVSSADKTFRVANPADTRDIVGEFQLSSQEDAAEAIDVAYEAQKQWERVPPPKRGEILYKAAQLIEAETQEFARALTREEGKTLTESRLEVNRAVDTLRYFGGDGRRLNGETIASDDPDVFLYTMRFPLGVVSIITPWNFPIAEPAWKISPALVCGNSIVFKPASITPHIAWKFVKALVDAGLPPGVLNFVTGPGATVGQEMVQNRKVAGISFTGSYEVGTQINEEAGNNPRMPRIQLEMGGKNPLVVLSDADLEKSAEIAAKGAFGATGQVCTATSRVIVEESIADDFIRRLVSRAEKIRVGNGLNQDIEMGEATPRGSLSIGQIVGLGRGAGS